MRVYFPAIFLTLSVVAQKSALAYTTHAFTTGSIYRTTRRSSTRDTEVPHYAHLSETNEETTGSGSMSMKAVELPLKDDASEITSRVLGLISGLSQLSPSVLLDATASLDRLLSKVDNKPVSSSSSSSSLASSDQEIMITFVDRSILAAASLCYISNSTLLKSKKGRWNLLQNASLSLLSDPCTQSDALSAASVSAILSLHDSGDTAPSRAAASAMATVVSRQTWQQEGKDTVNEILRSLLAMVFGQDGTVDLHIVTCLARAFETNGGDPWAYTAAIRRALYLGDPNGNPQKSEVAAALSLASWTGPWEALSPVPLVEIAVDFDLWHAADLVCASAERSGSDDTRAAVLALIDSAFNAKIYRQADTFATKFYLVGGESRFVEARLLHACDTISKVVLKRQLPIIERQVERVDRAVARVGSSGLNNPGEEVRTFALRKLEEAGELDGAHRLAEIWGMQYEYNEEVLLMAAEARRKKYLQWSEIMPKNGTPELVSTPDSLLQSFENLGHQRGFCGPFGFDVEWGEDEGAAVLQIATTQAVVLVDVPALSVTPHGADALKKTVGLLFACSRSVVVGFSCKQDLSRLRTSPCFREQHWLGETGAVVDVQNVVGETQPKLRRLGLARVCEFYLGKPLNKAEQCSLWTARPLSRDQLVYAALDAVVCAAIHEKLFPDFTRRGVEHVL